MITVQVSFHLTLLSWPQLSIELVYGRLQSHDLFICPRDHYCENSNKYLRVMAKLKVDIEDLHESSLDSR